jgi:DNA-binding NtrC family response regulator
MHMSGQMPDAAPSQQASPDFRHQHVGNSHATRLLQQQLRRLAGSETPVLLVGEAGTGKELAARAIHNSGRAMRPFLAMNCAGIPDDLVENELFGYEEAAFTGATAQKKGGIERAAGGTLFFEEIGDLSLELQRKLLCVLQQRELTRVGGTQAIPVGFRLISASIRPMVNEVLAGRFRAHLYSLLTLVEVPPLRERRSDIPALARFFVAQYKSSSRWPNARLSAAAVKCLMGYSWPGNVRELQSVIEHALTLASGEEILPCHLMQVVTEGW